MLNFKKEFFEIRELFKKINKKDFQGNTGIALKNSSYQFLINLSMKIGSLIFTIIMARILLPEKMGLYSLALSTIVFFAAFSDLGLSNALFTYIPKKLSQKKQGEAKGYFDLFLKIKIILLLAVSIILISLSYFISHNYYNQPIFYALLVSGFYIITNGFFSFYEQLFKSTNNFKVPLVKEIIFQILRAFLIPLLLILLLKNSVSNEILISLIFLVLSLAYFISFFYMYKKSKKEIPFLSIKPSTISRSEKKNLLKFLIPLTVTSISGIFFGYIDIIMLGRYVQSEFISYYSTAFTLIASIGVIISFISTGTFPLMASLSKKKLNEVLKTAMKYSFLIASLSSIAILLLSNFIINLLYGIEYINSAVVLRYYVFVLFTSPLISLYENYFISQKKTKFLAYILVATTLINIIFNFFFIRYGVLHYGGMGGILGACFATIISRLVYLAGLFFKKK